jgi:peptide-methionine (S)-S-oxide reductase
MADKEVVTLGGGCFWCLEAVYHDVRGVESAISGYMGGRTLHPTYEEVCGGRSGHVEVVQVTFDSSLTSFLEILEIFFVIHDPTTLNRQGNDIGTQYRSVIYCHSPGQRETAEAMIRELTDEKAFNDPIVTTVEDATQFWPAEPYHQDYLENNPMQPYCAFVVAPKLAKFRRKFAELRKS